MDNPEDTIILPGMETDTDILIVGGGLNGPTLALALAGAGLRVTVLDALPAAQMQQDAFDGRSYALALGSQRLLSALGLWLHLQDHAQPILEIKVSDGHAGQGPSPFFVHFDHAEIEEGPMGFMLEDRFLRQRLLQEISTRDGITVRNEARVVGQDVDGTAMRVTLENGDVLTTRLLVGADGRQSGVATRAGIKRLRSDYKQTAMVCAIAHEKPHHGIAQQFFMPTGPLAILPLPGNRSSIVWSETAETAALIQAQDDADYLTALAPRFGGFLGEISLAGQRFTYPLSLSLAEEMVAPRLALVGDAAHGVHPLAGQGLNAGFKDLGALAEVVIEAHRRGEDFGSEAVLSRYEQWRRFDNTTLAMTTDTLNRLFSNNNPALRLVRDLGLGMVNAVPALRRGFIREAAGLTGDLPRLMKGQPV